MTVVRFSVSRACVPRVFKRDRYTTRNKSLKLKTMDAIPPLLGFNII